MNRNSCKKVKVYRRLCKWKFSFLGGPGVPPGGRQGHPQEGPQGHVLTLWLDLGIIWRPFGGQKPQKTNKHQPKIDENH